MRKAWANELQSTYHISVSTSCKIVCLSRCAYYYQHKVMNDSQLIEVLSVPNSPNVCWSMDFMSDSSRNQQRFRTFNVIDYFNREVLGIDISVNLPATRVVRYLGKLAQYYGNPNKTRVDNGSEFTGKVFTHWAKSHQIMIDYIEPGSPHLNGYIERFNRIYRQEVLDLYLFDNLEQARKQTDTYKNW